MDGWWQCCPINYTLNTREQERERTNICGMRVRDSHRMSKVFFGVSFSLLLLLFFFHIYEKIFDVVCFYSLSFFVSLSFSLIVYFGCSVSYYKLVLLLLLFAATLFLSFNLPIIFVTKSSVESVQH